MKGQWSFIAGLIFALIIAVFSVLNVDSVRVNFLFTQEMIPLIIVILASTLLGGLMVGTVGFYRQYVLQRQIKALKQIMKERIGPEVLKEVEQQLYREKKGKQSTPHAEQPIKENVSSRGSKNENKR